MRPETENYYMMIAHATAARSTCPRAAVGAIIVQRNRIIGEGYNGSPRKMPHCTDHSCIVINNHCIAVVHAEANVLLKVGSDAKMADLYVTHLPCIECSKLLINAEIRCVFYVYDFFDDRSSALGVSSQAQYLSQAGIIVTKVRI